MSKSAVKLLLSIVTKGSTLHQEKILLKRNKLVLTFIAMIFLCYASTPMYSEIFTSRVNCVMCGGSKICGVCEGTRVMTVTGLFLGNTYTLPCAGCDASGICKSCRGQGYIIIDNGLLNGPGSSSNNSSNNSSNSNYNKSTNSSSCRKCLGSGVCSTCNGKGIYFSRMYGVDKWINCPACSGVKRCTLCNGSGR